METADNVLSEKLPGKDTFLAAIGRFFREKPLGAAGGVVFALMLLAAIFAPWLAPQDPFATDISVKLQGPSLQHIMGTDELGRDVLSRIIYGARMSTMVGLGAVAIGSVIGSVIGLISGYLGGRADMYIQRVMDMVMAFPSLILAIIVVAALGGSTLNVIIAVSFPAIPGTNRVVRSVTMAVRELQYVEAAKGIGASWPRILFIHVLPNCVASYLIMASALLAGAILAESGLSFLGLGVPPPEPSWGRSLSEAKSYMYRAPWLSIFPGLAVSLIVFGVNMLGDALRDVLDPRLKKV